MLILIWIRKIYKALSSDASPNAIAFAVLFGLTLGCVPILSGIGMLLLLSILIVRVHIATALLSMGLSKLLCLLGLNRLFLPVGSALLETESLHGFWTWFLNLPIVAWLDLDRIAVTGGLFTGFLAGAILYFPIRQGVLAYRRFLHDRVSQNKFFKWLTNFWVVKILRFIFVGGPSL